MKAYVITILGHTLSEVAAETCIASSQSFGNEFKVETFEACTPIDCGEVMSDYGIQWDYPWEGEETDMRTGLRLSAYQTRDPLARIACATSHYKLWQKCQNDNEPILILEHDTVFRRKLDPEFVLNSRYNIVGLNDPIGATRRARQLYQQVKSAREKGNAICKIPSVDAFDVPQGLAGNSAYIIKPKGASAVIAAVDDYGLWPNDAIMCKQLVKRMGVTTKYYTHVQGLPSTTTD